MKKIIPIVVALVLMSCSSKQEQKQSEEGQAKVESFADKAKKYLNTAIDDRFPHEWQNAPQMSEREVLIANDSVFVEQFKMRYQNEYGGITNGEMTYVYIKTDSGLSYALEDYSQNHNKKFIMCMAEVFNRAPKGKYGDTWDVGDPELSYSAASIYALAFGKKIK